jgi:hypothetical protein
MKERTSFSVAGTTCRYSVDLLAGYRYAQAFAPKDRDYIALEPMTAPTSALTSGRGLRFVAPVGDSGQCSESVSMEPNDASGSSPVRPAPKRDPGIGENICVGGQL